MAVQKIDYLWQDRKRHFGLPLSFTRFMLSEDRLFMERGLVNLKASELLLYRIRDLELSMSLWQRIFGVGTICVKSTDQSTPDLDLVNVKNPREVKEMIHQLVEDAKNKRRMSSMEIMGGGPGGPGPDMDGDGFPDHMDF